MKGKHIKYVIPDLKNRNNSNQLIGTQLHTCDILGVTGSRLLELLKWHWSVPPGASLPVFSVPPLCFAGSLFPPNHIPPNTLSIPDVSLWTSSQQLCLNKKLESTSWRFTSTLAEILKAVAPGLLAAQTFAAHRMWEALHVPHPNVEEVDSGRNSTARPLGTLGMFPVCLVPA